MVPIPSDLENNSLVATIPAHLVSVIAPYLRATVESEFVVLIAATRENSAVCVEEEGTVAPSVHGVNVVLSVSCHCLQLVRCKRYVYICIRPEEQSFTPSFCETSTAQE